MKMYFFGVGPQDHAGHYLHDSKLNKIWSSAQERELPFRYTILDGGLLPSNEMRQGKIYRSHINGFTIITMVDLSKDHRGGSNASFVVEGDFNVKEMIEICSKQFPELWEKIKPTE